MRRVFGVCFFVSSVLFSSDFYTNEKNLFDRAIDGFGTSRFVEWCDTLFNNQELIKMVFNAEDASARYQEWGKEAQQLLGVPEDRHVSLFKMTITPSGFEKIAAFTFPGIIIVNENRLRAAPYGAQKCALFHEAVHVKYADPVASGLVSILFLSLGIVASHKAVRDYNFFQNLMVLRMITPFLAGMAASSISGTLYSRYMERRADIEACYALECYKCVEECAVHRKKIFEEEHHHLAYGGYLWADDFLKIANEVKVQGKICCYHKGLS